MTAGKGNRSRDPNELAKWIVEQSASETPEPEIVTVPVSPPPLVTAYGGNRSQGRSDRRETPFENHDQGSAV